MNSSQIEKNLEILAEKLSKSEFIFDLLLAYGTPKATAKLLKDGRYNLSKQSDQVILKKKLFFQKVKDRDLHETIDELQKDSSTMRHDPRFIIVTDYKTLLAVDTKTKDQLDIEIKSIAKHFDFFLPWAGIEKHRHNNENPADRKAAEKMAKLYDGILAENNIDTDEKIHDLNVFLSRLLFCFFSEDTNIFEEKIFTNSIASHTQSDGSDLDTYLGTLFDALNTQDTSSYPKYLQKFPYVNGGLFAEKHWIPRFSARSRKIIVECGELNWAEINPDIFGSMMQAVMHPGQRASLGMHYTSVPNIMKVIEPLFLNELREEFEKQKENKKKLKNLLGRITKIKIFDPACGSGNFLIIAYKELRRLEMKIIKELNMLSLSGINLVNFYGIEIDDFAHEISKLSLYLAEHQMNVEFFREVGKVNPTLPLKVGGNIVCENATRIDWENVCPKNKIDEIYILGNPPYLGARNQNKEQKKDVEVSIGHIKGANNLDYIACWFYKASEYISNINARFSFVSTNSICQGSQVSLLWPELFKKGLELSFAHQSFKWVNNAKGNAGVTCVIVGMRNIEKNKPKYIFRNSLAHRASNINGYLLDANNYFIEGRRTPISKIPVINYGSFALDDGNYTLTEDEKREIIKMYPEAEIFFRPFVGAKEIIQGNSRYCLWINDDNFSEAIKIPPIERRIEKVKLWRMESDRENTKKLADTPHLFAEIRQPNVGYWAFPTVSSERREYIPIKFLQSDTIASNQIYVIPTDENFIFGLLSSKMHMTWLRAVAGRLKMDYRYSSALCYNTFPIPNLTTKQKDEINTHVYNILEVREKYSENTMAQLYDLDKMPAGLREAHQSLDLAIERCYRSKPFTSDEERLETLFKLYEQMIKEEKGKK